MGDDGAGDVGGRFEAFVALIARLRAPGGCPWDREQTHESLKPMTLEEAYEVLEAIDDGDDEELRGELGDLLLQVVFHAQIASEAKRFAIGEVIHHVSEKMVRRHPHVFGEAKAENAGEVLRNWEALKAEELRSKGKGEAGESMLDGVSGRFPAVMEAFQLTTKASRVGFDWPDVPSVLDKLDEEAAELKRAIGGEGQVAEEVGDLLFSAVNVARKLGVDPESALKSANRKFRRRFRYVEEKLKQQGTSPAEAGLSRMDALWDESKSR